MKKYFFQFRNCSDSQFARNKSRNKSLFNQLREIDKASVSNGDGDPEGNISQKMNLYFTFEFRKCADRFSAALGLRTCPS